MSDLLAGEQPPIITACSALEEQLDLVKDLFEKDESCIHTLYAGDGPIHYAAGRGHIKIVEFLLSKKVPIDCLNISHITPLHLATSNRRLDMAKLLVVNGATINWVDKLGNTPLRFASSQPGALDLVKFLVENGADINYTGDGRYHTALYDACYYGNLDIVKYLVEQGAVVSLASESTLHAAVTNGNLEVAVFLISKGAPIDARDPYKNTPLHLACRKGFYDIVKLLIDNGALIHLHNNFMETPMSCACAEGYLGIVTLLDSKGYDFNCQYNCQQPLNVACVGGFMLIVEYILSKGVDVNSASERGIRAIHYACLSGHLKVVKLLMLKGADIGCFDDDGRTPLTMAASGSFDEIILLLLAKGASLNISDFRVTPVRTHLALQIYTTASTQKYSTIITLIRHGAITEALEKLPDDTSRAIYKMYRDRKRLYTALKIYRLAKLILSHRSLNKRPLAELLTDSKRSVFLNILRAFSLFGNILDEQIFDRIIKQCKSLNVGGLIYDNDVKICETQRIFYDLVFFPK